MKKEEVASVVLIAVVLAASGVVFALGSQRADARGTHGYHCKGRWPAAECRHLHGPRNDVNGAPPWFYNVPTP